MTETTTEVATQEQAPAAVQPEEQPAEAVTTPVSEPQTQPQPAADTAPEPAPADNSQDVDAAEFWSKKGIDITTPEGLAKATKSYQESEKRMHQTTQQQSELARQLQAAPVDVDTDNELVRQLAERVELQERSSAVGDFVRRNNITPEQDEQLGAWLNENETKRDLVLAGHMTLDEAFKLSGIGEADPSELKSQGGRQALEQLANQQRTTAPRGGATSPASTVQSDPILDALRSND